jgi:hypothetical protein
MLEMGFRPDITKLLRLLPPKTSRQTMLFSATMPADITDMAQFALNPHFNTVDTVGQDKDTHERVPQYCVVHPLRDTYEELYGVLREAMQVCACVRAHRPVRVCGGQELPSAVRLAASLCSPVFGLLLPCPLLILFLSLSSSLLMLMLWLWLLRLPLLLLLLLQGGRVQDHRLLRHSATHAAGRRNVREDGLSRAGDPLAQEPAAAHARLRGVPRGVQVDYVHL